MDRLRSTRRAGFQLEALEQRTYLSATPVMVAPAAESSLSGGSLHLEAAQEFSVPGAQVGEGTHSGTTSALDSQLFGGLETSDLLGVTAASSELGLVGLDPASTDRVFGKESLGGSGGTTTSATTTSVFEYLPEPGKALDATLKRSGDKLLLVDNTAGGKTLKEQPILEVSSVRIVGSDLDDRLKVDFTDATPWNLREIVFNGLKEKSQTGDRLEFILPAGATTKLAWSEAETCGLVSVEKSVNQPPDTFAYLGVESASISGGTLLTLVTPLDTDDLQIKQATSTSTQISGSSGGLKLNPVTFTGVKGVVLDAATNDEISSTNPIKQLISKIKTLAGKRNDQIELFSKLTATGLQYFTIRTGAGSDSLFLQTADFSLPVGGGVFGYDAGEGDDTVSIAPELQGLSGQLNGGQGEYLGLNGSRLGLTSVEAVRATPTRPLVLIPGLGASFANSDSLGLWNSKVGLEPSQLDLDPVGGLYSDWLTTLLKSGYRLGSTLFIANWDWRLPLAPSDGTMDGILEEITASSITDASFEHAVDYLGTALAEARNAWAADHSGTAPASVDILAYDAGGLIARAYLQSPAYGASDASGKALPKVNNLTTVGTPNRGVAGVYNILQDNWTKSLDTGTLGVSLGFAYNRILAGGRTTTPQGELSLVSITDDGTLTGVPKPEYYIAQVFRSLRDLLPTFDFIQTINAQGQAVQSGLNADADLRNNFLLDLNDGLDLLYTVGQTPLDRDPNRFVSRVLGSYQAIYSATQKSIYAVEKRVGGPATVASIADAMRPIEVTSSQVWFKELLSAEDSGDGVVLKTSAVGQFLPDARLGLKLVVREITRNDIGASTHVALLANRTVLTSAAVGWGVTPRASDYVIGTATSIVKRVLPEVKNMVLMVIQEPAQQGGVGVAASALRTMAAQYLTSVLNSIWETLTAEEASSTPDPNADPNIIRLDDGILPLGSLPAAPVIRIDNLFLKFTGFSINKSSKTVSGTVAIGADTIAPIPNHDTALRVLGIGVEGSITIDKNQFKAFTLKASELRVQIKDYILAYAKNISITPMTEGDERVLSVASLGVEIPILGFGGELLGFEVTHSGKVFAVGASFSLSDKFNDSIVKKLSLGSVLPLNILGGSIKFAGDTNNNNLRDAGEEFDLLAFDLQLRLGVNQEFISRFPFKPVVQIGPQDLKRAGDEITVTVNIGPSGITPKDIGPIKLGFSDLKIGPAVLGASITLGGYQNGVFKPEFGGTFKIVSGLDSLEGGAEAQIKGSYVPETGTLTVAGALGVGFSLKDGVILVRDALLNFGFVMKVDAQNDYAITFSPPAGQQHYLGKLSVGLLQLKLSNFLTLQARKTTLDFNATGDESMLSFGSGSTAVLDAQANFDPDLADEGALSALFGDGAGPLKGWGGAVGNFAISAKLEFKLLPGFFIQLQVGPSARFGLPAFLPLELRSVAVQFNANSIKDGVLVDATDFTVVVSGGIKESGSWPIFGQFSGLRVNVRKMIDGDAIGAIENLNGFSVGVKNVSIGPVKVSGALALGIVSVDTTPDDGLDNPAKSFYFRIGGTFFYSGIGGGIDLVMSQYGPILATVSAGGLVEPTTGFVFGFKDAGFTFGGNPLPSVTDPRQLLENPVFYSPTTIDLAEIEKRIKSAMIKGVLTWNDSFTLTGTATVTNLYVQGLISGDVTLGANIGLSGPNAGFKILANGALNALGMPMGNAAMLIDFANPVAPRIDFAASLPAPNNPIGFLFPSNAKLLATLDTKGIIELPVVALGIFFDRVGRQALGGGQALFQKVVDSIAADAQIDHASTLSQILLDLNEDGIVSVAEDTRIITGAFLNARISGGPSVPGLLLTSFNQLLALSPDAFVAKVSSGTRLITELLPALVRSADAIDPGSLAASLVDLISVMKSAAIEGLAAGWKTFDPTLKLTGQVQPVLFGMPLGNPTQAVSVFINKEKISLEYEGSLIALVVFPQLGPLLNSLPKGLDGLNDRTLFTLNAKLPGDFLSVLIANLAPTPAGGSTSIGDYLVTNINPLRGWEVVFSSTMTFFGFKLGTVSGIIFEAQPQNAQGAYTPQGIFASRVVNLDPDGDQKPNADLLAAVTNGPVNMIPVNSKAQYETMMRYGGIAFTSQLYLPEIVVDPIRVIAGTDFTPVTLSTNFDKPFSNPATLQADADAVKGYLDRIVKSLTRDVEWARLQVFAASPASLFDLGNYLDTTAQGQVVFRDPASMSASVLEQAKTLLAAGFIEGYSDLRVLNTDLGKSYIHGGLTGIEAEVNIPWLVGLKGQFGFGHRTVSTQDMVYDLLKSPLLSGALQTLGISDPAARFAFLKNAALASLPSFNMPVAGLEVSFDSSRLASWMTQQLGLPSGAFAPAAKGASGVALQSFFGAYSLGYGAAGESGVKRYGGFVLDSKLNLPGILEGTAFHFELELFSFLDGGDPATFLIPSFHATSQIERWTVKGLDGEPTTLLLQDFLFDLRKDAAGLRLSTQGDLVLFGSLHMAVDGAFEFDSQGFAADLAAQHAVGQKPAGVGFQLEGDVRLQINTSQTLRLGVPARTSRLRVEGALTASFAGLGTLRLDGVFLLNSDPTGWLIGAAASADLGPLGVVSVAGSFGVGSNGLYGSLAVNLPAGRDQTAAGLTGFLPGNASVGVGGFRFDGLGLLEFNTSTVERSLQSLRQSTNGTQLPATVVVGAGTYRLVLAGVIRNTFFDLNGNVSLSIKPGELVGTVDSRFIKLSGDRALLVADALGVVRINADGLAASLTLTQGTDRRAPELIGPSYRLSTRLLVEINTTGYEIAQIGSIPVNLPPGRFRAAGDGALDYADTLGAVHRLAGAFELGFGVDGFTVTAGGDYTYSLAGRTWIAIKADASLQITNAGVAGRLRLGLGQNVNPLGAEVDFGGFLLAEINSTGALVSTIQGRKMDIAPGAQIYADATLGLRTVGSSSARVSGSFLLQATGSGLEISSTARLSATVDGQSVLDARVSGSLLYTGGREIAGELVVGDKAFVFDGSESYANAAFVPPQTNFTTEMWFKTTDPNAGLYSVADDSGQATDRGIYLTNGRVATTLWLGYAEFLTSPAGVNYADGKWHHVAHSVGANAGGEFLFVDGQLVAQGAGSGSTFLGGTRMRIGYELQASSHVFTGMIDEVRIWSRAMGGGEIGALMRKSVSKATPGYEDLVAYYDAEVIRGPYALDRTGRQPGAQFIGAVNVAPRSLLDLGAVKITGGFALRFNLGSNRVTSLAGLKTDLPAGLFEISGDGQLDYNDLFGAAHRLSGRFALGLTGEGLSASLNNASYSLSSGVTTWFTARADGALVVTKTGVVGDLQLASGASVALLGTAVDFSGSFRAQLNTTPNRVTTLAERAVDIDSGGRVVGSATLSLGVTGVSSSRVSGNIAIQAGASGLEIAATSQLQVSVLSTQVVNVRASGNFLYRGGREIAGSLALGDNVLDLTGNPAYVSAQFIPAQTEYTTEFWFRSTDPNSGMFSVSDPDGNATDRGIYLVDGDLATTLWLGNRPEFLRSTGRNYADGQWHHVAHVIGASVGGEVLYADGQEVARAAGAASAFNWGTRTRLGFEGQARSGYLTGQMDEVRIWDKALSVAEIATAMSRPVSLVDANYDKLRAYYDMEVRDAAGVFDRTGRSPQAVFKGGAQTAARDLVNFATAKVGGTLSFMFNLGTRSVDRIAGVAVNLAPSVLKLSGDGFVQVRDLTGGSHTLNGQLDLALGGEGLSVSASGTYKLQSSGQTWVNVDAAASLLVGSTGVAGRVQIARGAAVKLFGEQLDFSGTFGAEFNSTSQIVTTIAGQRVDIAPGGRIFGDATVGVAASGLASARVSGAFTLQVGSGGIEIMAVTQLSVTAGSATLLSTRAEGSFLYQGGTQLAGRLNVGNWALDLKGNPQYVNAPFIPAQTEYTTEFWFRTSDPNAGMFSVADRAGEATDRGIYLVDGNLATTLWLGYPEFLRSSGRNYADGQWHHVAHVIGASAGGEVLYADGVEVARGPGNQSTFNWGVRTRFGFELQARSGFMTGLMDEMRVWDKALTATEINSVMTKPISKALPFFDKLRAYYDVDTRDYAGLLDRTGRSPRADSTGGAWVVSRPLIEVGSTRLTGDFVLEVNLGTSKVASIGGLAVNLEPSLVRVSGSGALQTTDLLGARHSLTGRLDIRVSGGGLAATADGTYTYASAGRDWVSLSAAGRVLFTSTGVAGQLQLGSGASINPFGSTVDLGGVFLAEFNTTGNRVTQILTQAVNIDPGGRIYGDASLGLQVLGAASARLSGAFSMRVGGGGLEISAVAKVTATVGSATLLDARAEGSLVYRGGSDLAGSLSIGDHAFQFNGQGNYINIPFAPPNTEFTHELWFRTTDTDTGLFSVANEGGDSFDRGIYLIGGRITTRMYGEPSSESLQTSAATYADGNWHHVAHVVGASVGGEQLYVDGQLAASGRLTGSMFTGATRIRVGYDATPLHPFFTGLVDEVRIWGETRTREQIVGSMSKVISGATPRAEKLLAYYEAELSSGVSSLDRMGRAPAAELRDGASTIIRPLLQIGATKLTGSFGLKFNLGSSPVEQIAGKTVALPSGVFAEVFGSGELSLEAGTLGGARITGSYSASLSGYGLVVSVDGAMDLEVNGTQVLGFSVGGGFAATASGTAMALDVTLRGDVNPGLKFSFNGDIAALRTSLGYQATFDGVDDFVQAPTMTVDYSQGITVEAWARYDSLQEWSRILDFGNGPDADNIILAYTGGNLNFFVLRGATQSVLSLSSVARLGEWFHVAATVDPTGLGRLYVNGELKLQRQILSPASVSRSSNFIARSNWGDPALKGAVDEVRIWNQVRTVDQIRAGMGSQVDPAASGLVLAYGFDGETDRVVDASPNHFDGTWRNGARPIFVADSAMLSRLGSVGAFDGVDDYGLAAQPFPLANQSFSVEFWAKRADTARNDLVIGLGVPGGNSSLHLGFRGDTFMAGFYGNDLVINTAAGTEWHHWAVTYDAGSKDRRIYMDGVLVGRDVSSGDFIGVGGMVVGRAVWGEMFAGSLDEVRVWSGVRSQAQVRANMVKSLSGPQPGLLANWSFNPGPDFGIVQDSSGNGRALQLFFGARVQVDAYAHFRLEANLTGQEWNLGGVRLEAGRYVRIQANAVLKIGGLEVQGAFKLVAEPGVLSIEASGQVSFAINGTTLARYAVNGGLRVSADGIVGVLSASTTLGWDAIGLRLSGVFNFQFNTTNRAALIAGKSLEAGIYARLEARGRAVFAGGDLLGIDGAFQVTVEPAQLRLHASGSLSLFGTIIAGSADFIALGEGIAGRVVFGGRSVTASFMGFSGQLALEVNTSNRTLLGVAPNTLRVIVEQAQLNVAGFTLSGSIAIGVSRGLLEILVPANSPLSVSLFGLATAQVSGFLRSDGTFGFHGVAAYSLGSRDVAAIEGLLDASISNAGWSISLTSSVFVLGQTVREGWVLPVTSGSFGGSLPDLFFNWGEVRFNTNLSISRSEANGLVINFDGNATLFSIFKGQVSGSFTPSSGTWNARGNAQGNLGADWLVGAHGAVDFTITNGVFQGAFTGNLVILNLLAKASFSAAISAENAGFSILIFAEVAVPGVLASATDVLIRGTRRAETMDLRVEVSNSSASLFGGLYSVSYSGWFDTALGNYQLDGSGYSSFGSGHSIASVDGLLTFTASTQGFSGYIQASVWILSVEVLRQTVGVDVASGLFTLNGTSVFNLGGLGDAALNWTLQVNAQREAWVSFSGDVSVFGLARASVSGAINGATKVYSISGAVALSDVGSRSLLALSGASISFTFGNTGLEAVMTGEIYILGRLMSSTRMQLSGGVSGTFTISGTINLGALTATGALDISIREGVIEATVNRDNPLILDLPLNIKVRLSGTLSNHRSSRLVGSVDLALGSRFLGLAGRLSVDVGFSEVIVPYFDIFSRSWRTFTIQSIRVDSTFDAEMQVFGVAVGRHSGVIQIGSNPFSLNITTSVDVLGLRLSNIGISVTLYAGGYMRGDFTGTALLFGNSIAVGVSGAMDSAGYYSFKGSIGVSVGSGALGAAATLTVEFGRTRYFNIFTGLPYDADYGSISASGSAWAGVWFLGLWHGVTINFSATVDLEGNFVVTLRPLWWDINFYGNLRGAVVTWASELKGGKVYFTRNLDGSVGAGDPSVQQDENGNFIFLAGDPELNYRDAVDYSALQAFDLDGDDVLSEGEGWLMLRGGKDLETGLDQSEKYQLIDYGFADIAPYAGALVWLDENQNGEPDVGELQATTDEDGYYDFYEVIEGTTPPTEDHALGVLSRYDLDRNGSISADEGSLVLSGGILISDNSVANGSVALAGPVADQGATDRRNALVFLDANHNGIQDAGELAARTDANGAFAFLDPQTNLGPLLPYDLNGDGLVEGLEGSLISTGGTFITPGTGGFGGDFASGVTSTGFVDHSGARVFLDLDGDGRFDANEPSTFSHEDGWYAFEDPASDTGAPQAGELGGDGGNRLGRLSAFDLNNNGSIDGTEGTLRIVGGRSVSTNAPNTSVLDLPDGAGLAPSTVADGKVFLDLNDNKEPDPEEPYVYSRSDGFYTFVPLSQSELAGALGTLVGYDKNLDGRLDESEGQITVLGGYNPDTRLTNGVSKLPGNPTSGTLPFNKADLVFFDLNKNGQLDPNEPSVLPNARNYFSFREAEMNSNLGPLANFDTNKNGKLDADEGVFVSTGGFDVHAKVDNQIILRQMGMDFGTGVSMVASPLTNLQVSMVAWWGIEPGEAERMIIRALGIPPSIDLNHTDPLKEPQNAVNALGFATQVTNLFLDSAALLRGLNPELDELAAQVNVSDALADYIILKALDQMGESALGAVSQDANGFFTGFDSTFPLGAADYRRDTSGNLVGVKQYISLEDVSVIDWVLRAAADYTGTTVTADQVQTVSSIIAAKNHRVVQLMHENVDKPLLAFARFKAVTQLEVEPAIALFAAGEMTGAELLVRFTGQGLLDKLLSANIDGGNVAPWVGGLTDVFVAPASEKALLFAVDDADQALSQLTVRVLSDNESVVSAAKVQIVGDGAERQLVITTENAAGVANLRVVVSDGSAEFSTQLQVDTRLLITRWSSVAAHGTDSASVEHAITLDSADQTVESRAGGVHEIEVQFSHPVDAGTFLAGNVRLGGQNAAGEVMDLSGLRAQVSVADDGMSARIMLNQSLPSTGRYRVELLDITDTSGHGLVGDLDRVFGVLLGDVNSNGRVDNADLSALRSRRGAAPSGSAETGWIRSDLNLDGTVDALDATLAAGQRGTGLYAGSREIPVVSLGVSGRVGVAVLPGAILEGLHRWTWGAGEADLRAMGPTLSRSLDRASLTDLPTSLELESSVRLSTLPALRVHG